MARVGFHNVYCICRNELKGLAKVKSFQKNQWKFKF